jgi:hypothetical protein
VNRFAKSCPNALQQECKPSKDTSEDNTEPIAAAKVDGEGGIGLSVAARSTCCRDSPKASYGGTAISRAVGGRGCCTGSSDGRIHALWTLSTTGVLRSTGSCTGAVLIAIFNTLVAVLRADEVGKSLRVLGCVRLLSVPADTSVSQGSLRCKAH